MTPREHSRRWVAMPSDNGGADMSLVSFDANGKPWCANHGAMNKVSPVFWRCITTSSANGGTRCRAGISEATP